MTTNHVSDSWRIVGGWKIGWMDGWMEVGRAGREGRKEEGKAQRKCCVYLPESVFICFAVTEI